jgi:hypothetical protein
VSDQIFTALACELALIVSGTDDEKEEKVYALLVECGIVVAFYNTVSRFLLAFDVAGMANDPVPDPADPVIQGFVLPFFGARISLVTQLYSQYHAS